MRVCTCARASLCVGGILVLDGMWAGRLPSPLSATLVDCKLRSRPGLPSRVRAARAPHRPPASTQTGFDPAGAAATSPRAPSRSWRTSSTQRPPSSARASRPWPVRRLAVDSFRLLRAWGSIVGGGGCGRRGKGRSSARALRPWPVRRRPRFAPRLMFADFFGGPDVAAPTKDYPVYTCVQKPMHPASFLNTLTTPRGQLRRPLHDLLL